MVGATTALRDGMRERRRSEWCDRGGRSSFFRRKMRPRSGMWGPLIIPWRSGIPSAALIPLRGPLGQRSGAPPRCAPWNRGLSYDLRRGPCDHPDFTSNALHDDLLRGSLNERGGGADLKPINII